MVNFAFLDYYCKCLKLGENNILSTVRTHLTIRIYHNVLLLYHLTSIIVLCIYCPYHKRALILSYSFHGL